MWPKMASSDTTEIQHYVPNIKSLGLVFSEEKWCCSIPVYKLFDHLVWTYFAPVAQFSDESLS